MEPFDVYPVFPIELTHGKGSWVFDKSGNKYLDFYGGHAVISIGHSHPHFLKAIQDQSQKLAFYSNSIRNPLQKTLAEKLGQLSGYPDYQLFLCNSGAEANENALKLASFFNERDTIIAFDAAFHGRTSLAVAATDNPKIQAKVNQCHQVVRLPLNDTARLAEAFQQNEVSAVIIEGVQGVGGINIPTDSFLAEIRKLCDKYGAVMVLDEVQSGYGRCENFFAYQSSMVSPDLITIAKGMGNGFPIGGVLIHPKFQATYGLLGTTFGGNHLACAAGNAVLEVIENEGLIKQAKECGHQLSEELKKLNVKEVKGKGLMIGIDLGSPIAPLRKSLLNEFGIFTGSSANPNVIRLLPPLNIQQEEIEFFLENFDQALKKIAS